MNKPSSMLHGSNDKKPPEKAPEQTVYALVAKSFSPKSPISCVVTDKHGTCYYLKRGFTLGGQPLLMHLTTKHAVWFTKPEGEQNGRIPIIENITNYKVSMYKQYSRLIRGIGIDQNKLFMHDFKAILTLNEVDSLIVNVMAPEGVPFIAGVQFELTKHKHKIVSKPVLSSFYQFTSERIDFNGCPWPIVMQNLWGQIPSDVPSFGTLEPYTRNIARCVVTEKMAVDEKILYVVPDGVWINLWKNSAYRLAQLSEINKGISVSPAQEFINGSYYNVKLVQSWISGNFYELKTTPKDMSKEKNDEATEYLDRLFNVIDPHFHEFTLQFDEK